jgi:hypothetical protein
MSAHYRWIAALLAVSALAACASTASRDAPSAAAGSSSAASTQRIYVTGSRIPQPADPRSGLPETGPPGQSVSRDDLSTYGLFDNLSGLRDLVPELR